MTLQLDEVFSKTLLDDVKRYWNTRADGYSQVNEAELKGSKRALWQSAILRNAPDCACLNVLDVGTGPGFFAVTLAMAGHRVTAVDVTPGMLEKAKANAREHDVDVNFVTSDVHRLPFADDTFDLLVTRNVTWNLKYPKLAYQEWRRVLKPGGRLINFDANWYLHLFDERYRRGYLQDRQNAQASNIDDHYANTDTVAMENIARELPLSREMRPGWDSEALLDCGFHRLLVDTRIAEGLWDEEEKINYASTPMFMIVAEK
ncbi:SAM-dependent methyltransferase [Leminorella grimontii]|uniref:SAM-dependent methyltransferase n=1 Tax=Leminorella grimontii TaxID=82981 RepID=A0AAV5N3N9_9GAMM|nr:class I SAM-dependent methyltransferase [Leminorella grimontii]KFC97358.1 SmtA family protein [Leminorella grimontii ATCC 33999 = DSM 5078]GKX55287.1 SAM-dependent methyltransferase [Leminorella grimontii]VFS56668.1 Uncharacterized methyltransferase ycgJ [Leminorella grimontii]